MQKTHRQHNESSETIEVPIFLIVKVSLIIPWSCQFPPKNTLCYISMINSFHVTLYMFAGPDCFLQNEG